MHSDLSTHSLTVMSLDEAKALVRRYLGSFPSLNLHDPEIYIADLCTLLCGYPLWIAERAIEKVKDTIKFPATRAEIKPHLEDNARIPRYVREWENGARGLLADRTLLLEGPKLERLTYEQLKAKYGGENWGIDTGRPMGPSPEECRQMLAAQIGQEAFDAIPNAPPRNTGLWSKMK